MNNYDFNAKKTSQILDELSNLNQSNAFTEFVTALVANDPFKMARFFCGKDDYCGEEKFDDMFFIVKPDELDPLLHKLHQLVVKFSNRRKELENEVREFTRSYFSYREEVLHETFWMAYSFLHSLSEMTIAVYQENNFAQFSDSVDNALEGFVNTTNRELDTMCGALATIIPTVDLDRIAARLMRFIGEWVRFLEFADERLNVFECLGRDCRERATELAPSDCESSYGVWRFNPFAIYTLKGGRL